MIYHNVVSLLLLLVDGAMTTSVRSCRYAASRLINGHRIVFGASWTTWWRFQANSSRYAQSGKYRYQA